MKWKLCRNWHNLRYMTFKAMYLLDLINLHALSAFNAFHWTFNAPVTKSKPNLFTSNIFADLHDSSYFGSYNQCYVFHILNKICDTLMLCIWICMLEIGIGFSFRYLVTTILISAFLVRWTISSHISSNCVYPYELTLCKLFTKS